MVSRKYINVSFNFPNYQDYYQKTLRPTITQYNQQIALKYGVTLRDNYFHRCTTTVKLNEFLDKMLSIGDEILKAEDIDEEKNDKLIFVRLQIAELQDLIL